MTLAQAAVLHDHLATLFPGDQAAEFMRWIQNSDAVKVLLARSIYTEFDEGDYGCAYCGESSNDAHTQECFGISLLRQIDDPRAAAAVELAHTSALAEESRRNASARRKVTRAATMARKKAAREAK